MGEVLYRNLLPAERVELHRAIAQARSDSGGAPASQLAHHWHLAREPACALTSSVTAGLEAERLFAFSEAQRHLDLALELWDVVQPAAGTLPLDRVELLSRTAEAARFSGDRERAIELARRALEEFDAAADPARAARLLERLGEAHFWDDRKALELLRRRPRAAPARSHRRARPSARRGGACADGAAPVGRGGRALPRGAGDRRGDLRPRGGCAGADDARARARLPRRAGGGGGAAAARARAGAGLRLRRRHGQGLRPPR